VAVALSLGLATVGAAQQVVRPPPDPDGAESGPRAAEGRPSFHDRLDGAFDLSDVMIERGAFAPVPIVITEPALGGFGGGLAPVFIHKNPPVERGGKSIPVRPNITALAGAYTANDSWFAGGGRVASLPRHGIRYTVAGGYADINMDFYATLPSGKEQAFEINSKGTIFHTRVMKEVVDPRLTVGLQYSFAKLRVAPTSADTLPPFLSERSVENVISAAGPVVEFDSRDNIFTPDSGVEVHAHFDWSDGWLGSDFRYGRIDGHAYGYVPLGGSWADGKNWVSGFRAAWQQAVGDPPFYLLPFINMRGVPSARYQGRTTILVETEQRWDVTRRWSLVLFGGLAKAFDRCSEASDAQLVHSYGSGFRYLIARKFKLRVGVDVARGPEDWAYYIVFGSAWKR
jgi:hypothetical protein